MLPTRLKNISKTRLALGTLAGFFVLASAAFAYWTSTGEGEGTVRAGASAGALTIEAGAEPTGLYPGGSKEATVKIKNNEPYGEHFNTITAEVKEVENPASTEAEAEAGSKCWVGWYEITFVGGHSGASYSGFNETVAASSTVEKLVTVKLKELAKNENGCLNKKVTLKYKVE